MNTKQIGVLVTFKMVPNLEDLTENDWEIGGDLSGDHLSPEVTYARPILNPDDESALELALRLRDALGKDKTYLAAASVGHSSSAMRVSQTLMALGFGKVSLIEPTDRPNSAPTDKPTYKSNSAPTDKPNNAPAKNTTFDTRFRPDAIAKLLATFAKNDFQIIITGSRSADGQNGLTPMFLAEEIQFPLITEVLNVSPVPPDKFEVLSLTDDGLLSQTFSPPLVLAVGNAPSAFLRVPTLKDRLNIGQRTPEILPTMAEAHDWPSSSSLQALFRPNKNRETILVDSGSPTEKAAAILAALEKWDK
jgi:electron transfer flavoprotein alpha/beta subunit